MSNVVVARFKGSGEVECSIFLVDTWCLGVKNAMYKRLHFEEYQAMLSHLGQNQSLTPLSPSCARKLVSGAVSYASSLGFSPHRDMKKAWRVMGGIDPGACQSTYTFGYQGKPHYFQGPRDTLAFRNHVMNTLTKRLGTGNFHFTIKESDELGDFFDE